MSKYYPELSAEFKKLLDAAKGAKIAVVGHMRPDGDCIASEYAMAEILRGAGAREIAILNQNPMPRLYENFADSSVLKSAADFDDASFEIVAVDCADYARTNLALCGRFPRPLACIDHHATNPRYARINIIDSDASATAELIAAICFDLEIELSKRSAMLLYMGLVMDTRQFTTSSTRLASFEIAAKLVHKGADPAWVAVQLYQREKFGKLKLLGYYLDSLKTYFGGKVCIGILPAGIFEKTDSEKSDSDGLVDYARSVDGVEIAALIEELPNGSKGSLRAKNPDYRVDEIASVFGGGGHHAAAGFTAVGETPETLLSKLLPLIQERLK